MTTQVLLYLHVKWFTVLVDTETNNPFMCTTQTSTKN